MLTASQSFKLYSIVQRYFNKEEDAQAFVSEIENAIDKKYDVEKDRLATKEDLLKLQMELRVEIKEQKSEIIKWMSIFWVGQIAATLAIVFVYIKK
jgi:hypothetical protein